MLDNDDRMRMTKLNRRQEKWRWVIRGGSDDYFSIDCSGVSSGVCVSVCITGGLHPHAENMSRCKS